MRYEVKNPVTKAVVLATDDWSEACSKIEDTDCLIHYTEEGLLEYNANLNDKPEVITV